MKRAVLEYRTFVPFGWIAFKYCHLNFYGDNVNKLELDYSVLCLEKWRKYTPEIDKVEVEREKLYSKLKQTKWFKFKKRNLIWKEIYKLSDKVIELEEERRDNIYEEISRAQKFLKDNGFILKDKRQNGDEVISYTEIYELLDK